MLLSKFRFYIRDIFNFTQDEALKIYLDFYREKYCEDLAMKKASRLGYKKFIGYFMHKGATNWEDCVLSSSENFHEGIAKFFYEKKVGQELNLPKKRNVDYYYHGLIDAENTCKLAAKKRDYSIFHYFMIAFGFSLCNNNDYVSYSARAGDTRAVKYYWDRAGRVRSWYYADAVHSGNTELLQYIQRKGIYSAPGAVYEAIDCRNFDMLEYTLNNYDCPKQFINHATDLGYKDVVEFLFSRIEEDGKEDKIDLDKYMETSIKHKRQNMIKFFLKKIQEKKRRERCIIS